MQSHFFGGNQVPHMLKLRTSSLSLLAELVKNTIYILIFLQVGVPIYVAKILTFPERVNKANMKLMKELILNGPDKHPGANFVEQRGQVFKKALRFVNRNKVAQELKVRNIFDKWNGNLPNFNKTCVQQRNKIGLNYVLNM
jgi:hypothetical protein